MPKLIVLGTAPAVPSEQQDNSHMVLVGDKRTVLIDTSSNPFVRLRKAGVEPTSLTDLILTHFHPDHVSGAPLLLLDNWLVGQKEPLNVYGLTDTIERFEKMMDLFGWQHWPNFYPVNLVKLPSVELTPVMISDEFSIYASPVRHMIPTLGLRIEMHTAGKVVAYSCDTGPSQEVVRLAAQANVLLHEATGEDFGHSSAAQAGQVAQQAGVERLLLIHYDLMHNDLQNMLAQARGAFLGQVDLAQDFMVLTFEQ
jgi:ribonuclease Z